MNPPKISLIAAMDQKRGIGKGSKLPWHLPEDLKRFRQLTTGHVVIMGRKTFESIGRPLPNRTNIVVTHGFSLARRDLARLIIVYTLDEAIAKAKQIEKEEIFIIGGGQIFEQAIGLADKLYLTIIEGDFSADTFFPDYSDFKKVVSEKPFKSGIYKGKFLELERQDLRRSGLPENKFS